MDKVLALLSQMPQTDKVMKADTFYQENNSDEIVRDTLTNLRLRDFLKGKVFKQRFNIAATEWSRHKTLKISLRQVILPY